MALADARRRPARVGLHARAPPGSAAPRPRRPPSTIRAARASMRAYSSARSSVRPTTSVGRSYARVPEIVPARPGRPRHERRPPAPGPPGRTLRGSMAAAAAGSQAGQFGVERAGAFGGRARPPAAPHRRVGRGATAKRRQRRPQVEAGAADDQRPPAAGPGPLDEGPGQRGVLRRREALPGIHDTRPVRDARRRISVGGRLVGEHGEAPIDLHGVAGDDPGAQTPGQLDRHGGLADPGGPEQPDTTPGAGDAAPGDRGAAAAGRSWPQAPAPPRSLTAPPVRGSWWTWPPATRPSPGRPDARRDAKFTGLCPRSAPSPLRLLAARPLDHHLDRLPHQSLVPLATETLHQLHQPGHPLLGHGGISAARQAPRPRSPRRGE